LDTDKAVNFRLYFLAARIMCLISVGSGVLDDIGMWMSCRIWTD
jgi:hypothetical protein